ncbi:hypothetical protein HII12_004928 [Brettanomyces bruxellensis]|uniref:Uncharacterized protein n=1 Tax=Dekkera bruxellensis TaxID=5007 RepID=A0A8H6B7K5_DEKBR|nr:hypothetical protein HII12_004928 [Brettanomyces bruxellensis]
MIRLPVSAGKSHFIDSTGLNGMQSDDDEILSMVPGSKMRIIHETQSSVSSRSDNNSGSAGGTQVEKKAEETKERIPTSSLFVSDTQTPDGDSGNLQVADSGKSDSPASKKNSQKSLGQLFVPAGTPEEAHDDIEDGSLNDSDILLDSSSDELDHVFDGSVRTVPLGKSKPLRVERALFEEGAKRKKEMKKANVQEETQKFLEQHLSLKSKKEKIKEKIKEPVDVDVILLDDDDEYDNGSHITKKDDDKSKNVDYDQSDYIIDLDFLDEPDSDNKAPGKVKNDTTVKQDVVINASNDVDKATESKKENLENKAEPAPIEKHTKVNKSSNDKTVKNSKVESSGKGNKSHSLKNEKHTSKVNHSLNSKDVNVNNTKKSEKVSSAAKNTQISMDSKHVGDTLNGASVLSEKESFHKKYSSNEKDSSKDKTTSEGKKNSNSQVKDKVPKDKNSITKNSVIKSLISDFPSVSDDKDESSETVHSNDLEISDSEEMSVDKNVRAPSGFKSSPKDTGISNNGSSKDKDVKKTMEKKSASKPVFFNHKNEEKHHGRKKQKDSTKSNVSKTSNGSYPAPLSSRTRSATRKPVVIDLTSEDEIETLDSESDESESQEEVDSDGPIVKNAEGVELDAIKLFKKEPLDVHSFLSLQKNDKNSTIQKEKVIPHKSEGQIQNDLSASKGHSSRKMHTYKEKRNESHHKLADSKADNTKQKHLKQSKSSHKKKPEVAPNKKKRNLKDNSVKIARGGKKNTGKKNVTYSDIATKTPPKIVKRKQSNAPVPVYSTSCIHCLIRGRSRYCNRNYPCDFCEKDSLTCRYPRSSRVINQREIDSYAKMLSLQDLGIEIESLDSTSSNDSEVVTERNENVAIEKAIRLKDEANHGILKGKAKRTHGKKRKRAKTGSEKPKKMARNALKTSNHKKQALEKQHSSSPESIDDEQFVDASNEISDPGEDADEEDDDFRNENGSTDKKDKKVRKSTKNVKKGRKKKTTKKKKKTVAEVLGLDEDEENEEIWYEIKRQATRENYIDIPEGNESDLSEAEDAAEPLILSEDETERRMLRGQLPPTFVESMRQQQQPAYNSDQSDDFGSDSN